ncbi:hypothetical protein ACHFJ0_21870 [Paracoccus sp. NGMCC 1.201697]|uniref:Uncharacterized protein n=1 Tax=Paracoccus broussonetiae subsp. drimophilus TaxID=3373869 RepID=A0ABW7LTL8_9RHOB
MVESTNILIESWNYWLEGYHYNNDILVITFENLTGGVRRPDGYREGWGSTYFRKRGISHLCVKPKMADWYQKPDLPRTFRKLKRNGFFSPYSKILTYGASMGGFGALAYANLVGATSVLSLNPQSTMDRRKLPHETRFSLSQRQSWEGEFSDAAGRSSKAKSVYIFADMAFKPDRDQVERVIDKNTCVFNVPHLGHGIAHFLQRMGILSTIVTQVIDEDVDRNGIREALRSRRSFPAYYNNLLSTPRVQSSEILTNIIKKGRAKSSNRRKPL